MGSLAEMDRADIIGVLEECGWKVKGPNDASDPNYQEIQDTNVVLYLTMDGDYAVKAVFKCGGGVEPFAGVVLMVLGLGVVIRRLA